MRTRFLSLVLLFPILSHGQSVQVSLVPWATGLPTAVDIANCGDDRLFVVQQNGLISIVPDSMTVLPTPFLDLTDSVLFDGEQGLLGLAFDPDYLTNGLFYVNYISDNGGTHSRISRFTVSADANVADAASEEIIYTVDQPFSNHKGGDLDFGPDGFLYIPFGDGGDAGDPLGNAQDLSDPLGDIVRIDVSNASVAYTVPADNPYVGEPGVLPEIWASGLRNPYRFGFDRTTGDLWLGDVGQGAWEEIDHVAAGTAGGQNFGWRCYEGFEPYNTEDCGIAASYDAPATVHFNGGDGWCAIIGGRVYRGTQWPNLQGHYIYTDFCVGEFWSLTQPTAGEYLSQAVLTEDVITGWSCIGEDVSGELFAGNVSNGTIYRIVDRCPMAQPTITFDAGTLTSSPADAYQWFFNGEEIAGATQQTYTPTMNGDYFVRAEMSEACALKSDVFTFITTGLSAITTQGPRLLPNPADETVVIDLAAGSALRTLRVLDMQGREVLPQTSLLGIRTTLSTQQLPEGHYMVQFSTVDGDIIHVQRLTVAH